MRAILFKLNESQTERTEKDLSQIAVSPTSLLCEGSECIEGESGAKGGSRCHAEMNSDLFYKDLFSDPLLLSILGLVGPEKEIGVE